MQLGSGEPQRPGDGLPSVISALWTAWAAAPSFRADSWLPQHLWSGTLRHFLGWRLGLPSGACSAPLTFGLFMRTWEITAGPVSAVLVGHDAQHLGRP